MASRTRILGRVLGIAAALGITVYAVVVLSGGDLEALTPELLVDNPEPADPQAEREREDARLRALAHGIRPTGSVLDSVQTEVPPPPDDRSLTVTRAAAQQGFEHVVSKVEALGRTRRRLHKDEWDEVWRTANDAFTALSLHLDATDPVEAAELNEAHVRLKQALRKVRVRGGKF